MGLFKKDFIFQDINKLKGIGPKLTKYLKKKKIEKVKDIILNLPYSETDRTKIYKLNELEIGKIQTIKVKVKKLNFPRIRNLPNKINCEDETGKIDIVYFNSREGYLRKIFPVNEWIIISGKINFFKNKYQITNPDYVTSLENKDYVVKNIPKYSLTKGINEKKYRSICEKITNSVPCIEDWLSEDFVKKNRLLNWNESIKKLHNSNESKNTNSPSYRRLVFDEICANFITLSENRKRIKKEKEQKLFKEDISKSIINSLPFKLTKDQEGSLKQINLDLKNNKRMFRLLQGDVGSGKTIVSLLSIANVIESNYQCAFMAPTEILSQQHFNLAKKLFKNKNIKIEFLSGKTELIVRKNILKNLNDGKIDLLIGTHALFQKKIYFKKLGYVVIDEQHKFGLAQLHQLRGRVGRGDKQASCILLFKEGLSKNAVKRIKILKKSDDGFFIAEEDLKLRGFGDLIGYQQSGLKNFRFADPIIHEDLFKLAEKHIVNIYGELNQSKYNFLLKLFDKAEIINTEDF